MHELLRQFGAEKLGQETAAVRDRHCAYYAVFLQEREADLKGARQQAALAELEADSQNLRAAWQWAVNQHQLPQLRQAVDGLAQFYQWQGRYQEGEALFERAIEHLATASTPPGLRVLLRVSVWHASFSSLLQPAETVTRLFQQCEILLSRISLEEHDLQAEQAFLCLAMARHLRDFDTGEARRVAKQSLAWFRVLDDRWAMAQTLQTLGGIDFMFGHYQEAIQRLEEALTIQRTLGDSRSLAHSLRSLGLIAKHQGRLTQAEQVHREALAVFQEINDRFGIAHMLTTTGVTLGRAGNYPEGIVLLEESLNISTRLGIHRDIVFAQVVLGRLKILSGQYETARPLLQEALSLAKKNNAYNLAAAFRSLGMLALAEHDYYEANSLCKQGVTLFRQVNQPILLGLCLTIQAYAARGLGQPHQATDYLTEALQYGHEVGSIEPICYALPVIALLLADQGDIDRAVELYALANRQPSARNSQWFEDVAGRHIAAAAKNLPPEVVAAAQARGQARDLWQTVEEILAAPVQFGLA